jgi:hypothetical protein
MKDIKLKYEAVDGTQYDTIEFADARNAVIREAALKKTEQEKSEAELKAELKDLLNKVILLGNKNATVGSSYVTDVVAYAKRVIDNEYEASHNE